MSTYELTIAISGKATAAKKKSVQKKIGELVKLYKGGVVKFEEWGEMPFAAQIKKETSGNFLYFEIELEPGNIKNVDDKLRLDEEVIKYLLLKKER